LEVSTFLASIKPQPLVRGHRTSHPEGRQIPARKPWTACRSTPRLPARLVRRKDRSSRLEPNVSRPRGLFPATRL